ncbi:MAG: ABC transporter permease [Acidobacteriaceae bacterium]|nr:ABC transporter permease [Acidobacteriaceae bacterium]
MLAAVRTFLARVTALFHQQADERDIEGEIHAHLDLLTERYMRQGMSPEQAQANARRQFGGLTRVKEEIREQRSILFLEHLLQDVRYAFRQLSKSPAFALTAILTLALGIGANTAVFSVVYAVLLRPLPFKDLDKLVMVWEQNPHRGWYHNVVSAANFNDWRKQNHVFTDMALIAPVTLNLTGAGEPVEVSAEQVTPNLFSVLGVLPAYGRSFLPEEGHPKSARVVILGHALWKQRYAGDPSIIGRQIALNSENYTVIGIMPAGFSDVYSRSLDVDAQVWISGLDLSDPGRTNHDYIAIARLRPGVSFVQAQAEMNAIAVRLEKQYADNKDWGVGLRKLHDEVVSDSRPALIVLLIAVGLVLLIACVNLANLSLARGTVRMRELAVRKALGANRRRITIQLLTESFLLSTAGALIGLEIAAFGIKGLLAIAPMNTPGIETAGLNLAALGYTACITTLTDMLFGLLPALRVSKLDLSGSLKDGGHTGTEGAGAGRIQAFLVSGEFALALVLVVSAGLMVRTLVNMRRVEIGFQPAHVLSMRVPLNDVKYNEQRQTAFYRTLVARLDALPGVQHATVSRGIPFYGWDGQSFITGENPHLATAEMPDANYVVVGPQYFSALQIPLMKGRVFTDRDTDDALPAAIVNQELARREWPGQDPIGKRIRVSWSKGPWLTVVGVTGNVRTAGPEAPFLPEIYVPYTQHPWLLTPRYLLIRADADPLSIIPSVRQVIRTLDKDQPIAEVRPLDDIALQPLALRHFLTYLLGGFAVLALLLGAIGVYGVMAYSVAQRIREIGIRMALGATRRDVLRTVLQEGMRLGLSGLAVGFVCAIGATRLLSNQLYRVPAADPWTVGDVALLLAGVTLLAAYIPARRAARVDPISVLRAD